MQIIEQHIVRDTFGYKVLFLTKDNRYFVTDTGGFGQRDMTIKECSEKEAFVLLDAMKTERTSE